MNSSGIDLSILLVLQHWFPESHAARNGTCTLETTSKRSKFRNGQGVIGEGIYQPEADL